MRGAYAVIVCLLIAGCTMPAEDAPDTEAPASETAAASEPCDRFEIQLVAERSRAQAFLPPGYTVQPADARLEPYQSPTLDLDLHGFSCPSGSLAVISAELGGMEPYQYGRDQLVMRAYASGLFWENLEGLPGVIQGDAEIPAAGPVVLEFGDDERITVETTQRADLEEMEDVRTKRFHFGLEAQTLDMVLDDHQQQGLSFAPEVIDDETGLFEAAGIIPAEIAGYVHAGDVAWQMRPPSA